MDFTNFKFRWIEGILSDKGPEASTTILVLLGLSTWMSGEGGSCFPSLTTIADSLRLSKRCVIEHIKKAEDQGWLSVDRSHGRKNSNRYAARIPPEKVTEDHPQHAIGDSDAVKGDPHAEKRLPSVTRITSNNQNTHARTRAKDLKRSRNANAKRRRNGQLTKLVEILNH